MINRVNPGVSNQNYKPMIIIRKAPAKVAQNLNSPQNKAETPTFGSLRKFFKKVFETPDKLTPAEAFTSIVTDLKKASIKNNPLYPSRIYAKLLRVGKLTKDQTQKINVLTKNLKANNGHESDMNAIMKILRKDGKIPIV